MKTRNAAKAKRSKTSTLGLNGYTEVRCAPGDDKVELTYIKEAVVRDRRKTKHQFKQRLLYQLQNLQAIEHKIRLEEKVERWIGNNMDQLTKIKKRP
jgi:hypothetical protein|tara:strand:- start:175 stop:465 length:291 start_codon:yes stop_codon:yes gene_type:complete